MLAMSSNAGGVHNCGSLCAALELLGVAACDVLACGPRPELEFGLNMCSRVRDRDAKLGFDFSCADFGPLFFVAVIFSYPPTLFFHSHFDSQ